MKNFGDIHAADAKNADIKDTTCFEIVRLSISLFTAHSGCLITGTGSSADWTKWFFGRDALSTSFQG